MKLSSLLTFSGLIHKTLIFFLIGFWAIFFFSFIFIDFNWRPYGIETGNWALRLLWLASIPGILKRFRVTGFLQNIQIVLMKSRRRLGDLMFVFAIMHVFWNRYFFYIMAKRLPEPGSIPIFEMMGFFGLVVLIPLFVTSNDFSVRFLKIWWTKIHRLVYLAMWFVAFHVALQGLIVEATITFSIVILQITSWIYYKKYLNKNKESLS